MCGQEDQRVKEAGARGFFYISYIRYCTVLESDPGTVMQHVLYGRICYEFVRTYHFDYKCCDKEDYGDRGW